VLAAAAGSEIRPQQKAGRTRWGRGPIKAPWTAGRAVAAANYRKCGMFHSNQHTATRFPSRAQ
jgi:hypothetical protein